ncbi:MAG: hypothetical protein K8S97_11225 [Anaerolineae bacterium]|nr:hypothetical protein [Anaerolineae bacterium]
MADVNNNLPPADEEPVVPPVADNDETDAPVDEVAPDNRNTDDLSPRLERLGGEPAPDITPEEFARLQQAGQIHIDPRGRVRTAQRDDTDAGISLRKRRAWYGVA